MEQLLTIDSSVDYSTKEAGPFVFALAWVLAVGGAGLVSIMICGWRGTQKVFTSWFHGKVEITCR
jgi:hypothetical protein